MGLISPRRTGISPEPDLPQDVNALDHDLSQLRRRVAPVEDQSLGCTYGEGQELGQHGLMLAGLSLLVVVGHALSAPRLESIGGTRTGRELLMGSGLLAFGTTLVAERHLEGLKFLGLFGIDLLEFRCPIAFFAHTSIIRGSFDGNQMVI
jgi:hypothetical protein